MLNLSKNRIDQYVQKEQYAAFRQLSGRTTSGLLIRIMLVMLVIFIGAMFLPWTQFIRGQGYVTTLYPQERPQSVVSMIGGQIASWHVAEGQEVQAGDTIVVLTEAKTEYLDPQLLGRTQSQADSKSASAVAYGDKAEQLLQQQQALRKTRDNKLEQNRLKIEQVKYKLTADSFKLVAARTNLEVANVQFERFEALYNDGLAALSDFEAKKLKLQEEQAKLAGLENALETHRRELDNLRTNFAFIKNDYAEKIAKAGSERMTAVSDQLNAEVEVQKLESAYSQYNVRQANYVVRAPINGVITKAIQTGIGEILSEGEEVVTIVPSNYQKAVEIYVKPRDLPLLSKGNEVRLVFDGWPSIVFAGWPENSYGTFAGKVFAIDNFISDNGLYRVLIAADNSEKPWPEEVRPGGGANAILLLSDVKLGFELWRSLNGFPPSYYESNSSEGTKSKAPLRKVK